MEAALDARDAAIAARFEAVEAEIVDCRPREPHHRPRLLGGEGAIPFERILAGVARGREALDLAIGEGLRALGAGDRLMDLGYSRMTDYARQRLGLAPSTAREKERLARELATRPLVREAVRSGRLSPRKALEVIPVARGDAEEPWLLLAGALSVRELRGAVARARRLSAGGKGVGAAAPGEDPGAAEAGASSAVAPGEDPGAPEAGASSAVAPEDDSAGAAAEASGAAVLLRTGAPGEPPGSRAMPILSHVLLEARKPEGTAPPPGAALAAAPPAEEERWELLSLPLPAEDRAVVEEAMRIAGEVLGRGAPTWRRLEAMAQEFLGAHPEGIGEEEPVDPPRVGIPLEQLERAAEIESNGWEWLEAVEPVPAPELREMEPRALDARLRDLASRRERWDEVFGAMALAFVRARMATALGFAGLGQYLAERLGMSRRAFEQRVWLERRMEELPRLRDARERGELSYEKARLVAGVADGRSVHEWIRKARASTCAELERAVAVAEGAQACVRERLEARVPGRVAGLVREALRAAAEASAERLDPGGCLARIAGHFVETWGPVVGRRRTLSRKVQERDGGWCKVPACSRSSAQGHHVLLRSRGGGNGPENVVSMCAPHHLRGVHGGRLRVRGTAPDGLVWELVSGGRVEPLAP